jgi:hypothetical protein
MKAIALARLIFYILVALSFPFLLESALELYGMTMYAGGHGKIFFVLMHQGGLVAAIWLFSMCCMVLAICLGLILIIWSRVKTPINLALSRKAFLITMAFVIHLAFLASYDYWGILKASGPIAFIGLCIVLGIMCAGIWTKSSPRPLALRRK